MKLAGASRGQRKKNEDIRLDLRQWYKRYRDADYNGSAMGSSIDDWQITSKIIDNSSIGYKNPGKTEKKMDRQCQRGSAFIISSYSRICIKVKLVIYSIFNFYFSFFLQKVYVFHFSISGYKGWASGRET